MNCSNSQNRLQFSTQTAGLALLVMFSTMRCSEGNPTQPMSHTGDALDVIVKQHAGTLENLPDDPSAQQVVERLLETAERNGMGSPDEVRASLMYRFANTNIGVYLLDKNVAQEADPDRVIDYCTEVEAKAPGTPLALAALNKRLQALLDGDPTAFLNACGAIVNARPAVPEARVAIFSRAQYAYETARYKEAARDFVRFWATWPQTVHAMALEDTVLSTLRLAGFRFEAGLLELEEADAAAKHLWTEWEAFPQDVHLEEDLAALSPASAYFRYTPDIPRIVLSLQSLPEPQKPDPLYCVRLALLHTERLDAQELVKMVAAFVCAVGDTLQSSPPASSLEYLCMSSIVMIHELQKVRNFGANKISPRQVNELLLQINDHKLELARLLAADKGADGAPIFFDEVKRYVEVASDAGDYKKAGGGYRQFLAQFPNSESAPDALLALAEFTAKKLEAPAAAVDVYAELLQKYPNTPQAPVASVKSAILCYETKRTSDAYETVQLLLAEHPDCAQAMNARFLAALCEAELGLDDLAEEHMTEIARTPDPIAARALFWLGGRRIGEQAYDRAEEIFDDLMKRFPRTTYAKQAAAYMDRLAKITENASSQ